MPLVSVLMTVYNREKYITEAIESVLASTYQNWELVIVDDQSKDRSVEIAKHYEKNDQRIKVYVNEQNLGDYPNRNKAASYAKGKYLKYVDADDMLYPFGLEQLVYYMEKFPNTGYGLCSLDQDTTNLYPIELAPKDAYFRHYFQTSLFHKAPLSSIINREKFNTIGGFSGKQHLGDFELWHLLSQEYSVVLMPHGFVWYRVHDDQQMNDNRNDPYVPFKYLLCAREILSSKKCPLEKVQKKNALFNLENQISKAIISTAKHHSLSKSLELKNASGKSFFEIIKNTMKI